MYCSFLGVFGSLDFFFGCLCWEVDVLFDIGVDIESIGFVISYIKGKFFIWIFLKFYGND